MKQAYIDSGSVAVGGGVGYGTWRSGRMISREGTELLRRLLQGTSMCSAAAERRVCEVLMAWYEAMYERGVEGVWGRSLGRSR